MDKCRYTYTPYDATVEDDSIEYKDHAKMFDLKKAQAYCKEHGLTCISVSFEGYDPEREGGWYVENSETICFLDDDTWEQADYANLKLNTNY